MEIVDFTDSRRLQGGRSVLSRPVLATVLLGGGTWVTVVVTVSIVEVGSSLASSWETT